VRDFFQTVESRMRRSERVFLGLVVAHTPHSPGSAGARIAVLESGRAVGTIGGGVMEHALLERARRALKDGPVRSELCRLVHRSGDENASGLMCAGEQTNLYSLLDPARHLPAVQTAAACEKAGAPGHLFISEDEFWCDQIPMAPGEPQRNLRQEAGAWSYTEQLLNLNRVAILGGGHCGRALSIALSRVGYHVTMVDSRTDLPTLTTDSLADQTHIVPDMRRAASTIDFPELTPAVVMGTDTTMDIGSLEGALNGPFPFIGVMGSPAKISAIRSRLTALGFSAKDLSRITGPVGLPIGSRTPEEIAISVSAQILQRPWL
jgi:xanthine dehydrogenase accessory factor